MAISVTPNARLGTAYQDKSFMNSAGKRWIGLLTMDSSYVTGGETLAASSLGFSVVGHVTFGEAEGYSLEYDISASKVLARYTNTGANVAMMEVTSGTDLSPLSAVPMMAWGW